MTRDQCIGLRRCRMGHHFGSIRNLLRSLSFVASNLSVLHRTTLLHKSPSFAGSSVIILFVSLTRTQSNPTAIRLQHYEQVLQPGVRWCTGCDSRSEAEMQ
jgi:hypothetical protein